MLVENKLIINQGFKPINPLQCGRCSCSSGYGYGPAMRKFWLLHFVISGKGKLINERGCHEVTENTMFVIRPFETVTYTADESDPWSYIWIGFSTELPPPRIITSEDTVYAPYLRESFVSAYSDDYFAEGNTGGAYESFLCGVIWQIFGKLSYGFIDRMSVYECYIRPAISIMKTDYASEMTVSGIAARLHISRGYFTEIFKAEIGVSPKKYLYEIRMKKAADLILRNGVTLTVAASSVGYPDTFAFSRAFKAYYGCTPTEYKRKAENVKK